jgi:transposase
MIRLLSVNLLPSLLEETMIDRRTVFEIHRLNNLGYSTRKIARELGLDRETVKKYLEHPEIVVLPRLPKISKLDPYSNLIDQFLEQDPYVKAPVVLQRLCENGFDGKISIVRDCLQKRRGKIKNREAFIRFESPPGKQMQIDWGHFGSLTYGSIRRKLYAMAVVECHSRMLYVEFTHSQN